MKKIQSFLYLSFLTLVIFLSSCKTEDENPNPAADVIVINEGNFNSADGSLSAFNTQTKQVSLGIFESVNGFPLAGTIQNATVYNGKYYFVINSADKLEIVEAQNLSSVKTLRNTFSATNFATPYSFAAVGNKAYVSNWGTLNLNDFSYSDPFITLIDLNTNTVSGKINRTLKPQHLLAVGQNIYIANVESNTISVLNTADNQIVKEIEVANYPDKMVLDKNNKIWVICQSGNLVRVNPANNSVETTISGISIQGFNEKMILNQNADKLYWLGSGGKVFEMAITATTAPNTPIITQSRAYGIGADKNNLIYITDHNNYVGNGKVRRFQTNGALLDSLAAGRIPSGFIFK
jgi:YVTN family beta-propeller protein